MTDDDRDELADGPRRKTARSRGGATALPPATPAATPSRSSGWSPRPPSGVRGDTERARRPAARPGPAASQRPVVTEVATTSPWLIMAQPTKPLVFMAHRQALGLILRGVDNRVCLDSETCSS